MGIQEYKRIGEVTIVTTRPFSQGSENGRCSYDWGGGGGGGVKITFFIEDHMVTSRCLFYTGLSLGRWAVVSLTFPYINIMTLPLR